MVGRNEKLWEAAKAGDLDGVKEAIASGADINSMSEWEGTALHSAASGGHLEVVDYLLGAGADPLLKNGVDFIPLHLAARDGHADVVKLLLEKGGRVPERIYSDVMYVASMSVHGTPQIQEMLAKYQIKMIDPDTSELEKGEAKLIESAAAGDLDGVKEALASGVSPDAVDSRDTSALRWAVQRGHSEVVKVLLDAGADVDKQSYTGWTALMDACFFSGDIEMVRMLLSAGADPNLGTEVNGTALMFASLGGFVEVVRVLLEAGADPAAEISDGKDEGMTALSYARGNLHAEVVKLLQRALESRGEG
ncbi:MAG: ankyrin repeat domain-containing protein [Promethearchaeota archaeon]